MRRGEPRTVVATVGCATVIAVIAITTVLPRPTVAGVLGLTVIAICLAGLVRATMSGSFAPVAVTFWSFVAVWAGFAPLFQIRDDRLPWPDLPLHQFYVTAQVILLLAVAAFWAGYGRRIRPAARPATSPRLRLTIEKAVVVTAFSTALTVACLPQTGGLAVRFTNRDSLREAIAQAGLTGGRDLALLGLLSTLPAAAGLAALLLCLLCWRNRNYATRTAMWTLLGSTAVAATLNIIYNNPLSANRFQAFSVLLGSVLALMRFNGPRWRAAFAMAMLGGIAVIYPLANLFRNGQSRASLRVGLDAYYTWDFDGFQQTVNSVYYAHTHGHTWGHHIVSALLFWVPRSIWEGKAVGAGNVVAASRGYPFQNLALPFWAEVYLEFTLVGVVVLGYFYGKLARRLDRAVNSAQPGPTAALAVLFAACQIGLLRGPLGAQIPFAGAAIVVLTVGMLGWRGMAWGRSRPPVPGTMSDGGPPGSAADRPDPGPARVAVVADWWWPDVVGGAENGDRSAALALARSADVHVFVPAAREKTYADGPMTVHAVRRPFARRIHADSTARRGLEFLTAWLLPLASARLVRQAEAFRPHIVVAGNVSRTGPWLPRWARSVGLPFVRLYHDLSDTCWRRSRRRGSQNCATVCGSCQVKTHIMRWATPDSARTVCVSRFLQGELVDAKLATPETSLVGYPLIGAAAAAPIPPRPADGTLVVGYLGRLTPVKGVAAAIQVAAAYARQSPTSVRMLVAGEGQQSYRQNLVELAEAESLDVEFAGFLDIDTFCARIDAALIPSLWMEAFGRVAVEIGSRGRPMLVASVGGLGESAAVSGGRYAFADFQDVDAAVGALAALLDDSTIDGVQLSVTETSFEEGVTAAVASAIAAAPESGIAHDGRPA